MTHLHGIKLEHWRGLPEYQSYLQPGARVMFCSDVPGAGKSSIHSAVELALTGRCDGTDAAGKGAKYLIHDRGARGRVLVGIGTKKGTEMGTVGLGRELSFAEKARTFVSANGSDPDYSAAIGEVVHDTLGVAEEALLPLHRPLVFLAMSDKDKQATMLAACGHWDWEKLGKLAERSVDELLPLDSKLGEYPLRRAAKRIVTLVHDKRLAADKAATVAGTQVTERAVQAAKETVEPPSAEEIAEAEKAAKKARKTYEGYTRRCDAADEARARANTARKRMKTAEAAAGEGTGDAYKQLHDANGRVTAGQKELAKLNKNRKAAGMEPVSLEDPPPAPSDVAKIIRFARDGCPVCKALDEHTCDATCPYVDGDEALAQALEEDGGDTEVAYAAAMMILDELKDAQEAAAAANATIADAGTEARGLEQAEAELRAAQAAYRKAKPVKDATLTRAETKATETQAALVDLKAKAQAANTGAAERLAEAKAALKLANEESRRWTSWEKLLALDGSLMGSWVEEVGERYREILPNALKALSDGTLALSDHDGPLVNGRPWQQLSRGEKGILGVAVAGAWGKAIGVEILNLDDMDALAGALPHVLQVLNSNGSPEGTVLLYAGGAESRKMAEKAGWEVVML